MKKLNLTIDEVEDLQSWLGEPSFSAFVSKILPELEDSIVRKLASCELDERNLLIQRAKLEGAREVIRYIVNLKKALKSRED